MKTYQTALGYNYPLSRRTTLYTAAGWIHNDFSDDYAAAKPTAVENDYDRRQRLAGRGEEDA